MMVVTLKKGADFDRLYQEYLDSAPERTARYEAFKLQKEKEAASKTDICTEAKPQQTEEVMARPCPSTMKLPESSTKEDMMVASSGPQEAADIQLEAPEMMEFPLTHDDDIEQEPECAPVAWPVIPQKMCPCGVSDSDSEDALGSDSDSEVAF